MGYFKKIRVIRIKANGPAIRERRKELGLQAKELAKKVGVSTAYISHMETGRAGYIEKKIATRIYRILKNGQEMGCKRRHRKRTGN